MSTCGERSGAFRMQSIVGIVPVPVAGLVFLSSIFALFSRWHSFSSVHGEEMQRKISMIVPPPSLPSGSSWHRGLLSPAIDLLQRIQKRLSIIRRTDAEILEMLRNGTDSEQSIAARALRMRLVGNPRNSVGKECGAKEDAESNRERIQGKHEMSALRSAGVIEPLISMLCPPVDLGFGTNIRETRNAADRTTAAVLLRVLTENKYTGVPKDCLIGLLLTGNAEGKREAAIALRSLAEEGMLWASHWQDALATLAEMLRSGGGAGEGEESAVVVGPLLKTIAALPRSAILDFGRGQQSTTGRQQGSSRNDNSKNYNKNKDNSNSSNNCGSGATIDKSISTLVQLLQEGGTARQKEAQEVLEIFATQWTDVQDVIAEEGAIPVLFVLMQEGSAQDKGFAFRMLKLLAKNPAIRIPLIEFGLIPSLLGLLRKEDCEQRVEAALALAWLNDNPKHPTAVADAGGIRVVIDMLNTTTIGTSVTNKPENNAFSVGNIGGNPPNMANISTSKSIGDRKAACALVASLANNDQNRVKLIDSGIIPLLVALKRQADRVFKYPYDFWTVQWVSTMWKLDWRVAVWNAPITCLFWTIIRSFVYIGALFGLCILGILRAFYSLFQYIFRQFS